MATMYDRRARRGRGRLQETEIYPKHIQAILRNNDLDNATALSQIADEIDDWEDQISRRSTSCGGARRQMTQRNLERLHMAEQTLEYIRSTFDGGDDDETALTKIADTINNWGRRRFGESTAPSS